MKPNLTLLSKRIAVLTLSFLMLLLSAQTQAQLGVYSFTGVGACPNMVLQMYLLHFY
jgi:hypothetical protein